MQTGIFAPDQFYPCPLQYLCVAHTDVRDVVLLGDFDEVPEVRGVN